MPRTESLRVALPLLIVWEIVGRSGLVSRSLVPPFSDVIVALFDLLFHRHLVATILSSLGTFSLGISLAVILAVPLGMWVGWSAKVRRHILPILQLLAPIPPIAWAPLTMVIFGIGLPMKVFLVALGAFFPILLNTYQAVMDTDPRYVASARVFGATEWTLIRHVYFWNAFGSIISGVKAGIALGLIMLTAAEMYGGRSGIGFMLVQAKEFFQIPVMIACMIVLGLMGWSLIEVLKFIERKSSVWKEVRR